MGKRHRRRPARLHEKWVLDAMQDHAGWQRAEVVQPGLRRVALGCDIVMQGTDVARLRQ